MTVKVDQGVGGLDMGTTLAEIFRNQNERQEEIYRAHMDAMTALSQRLVMGSGSGGTSAALAGAIRDATLTPASSRGAVMIGGGSATAGQTTVQSLAQQAAQRQPTPQGGAAPAQPIQPPVASSGQGGGVGNPTAGQTTTGAGGPVIGGPGGPPGGPGGPGGPGSPPGGGWRGWAPSVNAQGGQGLVNSVWGKIKGKIPGVGIAEGAVNEYRSQLNKNLWYAGYGGEDTAGGQFGERMTEEMSRLWHPLAFDEEEARQAFKQATAMGYTSNARGARWSRREVVDLAAKAKTSYGATVGETMRDIDMLGRNGDTNFDRFVQNMDELNKIAGEAGVNVKQVAASFREMTQTNAGFYGSRGAGVSRLQAETQIGWGKSMQNIDMTDSTNNWQYRYMQAGMNGLTTSQMAAMEVNNPARAFGMQNRATLEGLTSFLQGSDAGAYQRLRRMVDERRTDLNGPEPDITAQQISDDWWASGPRVEIPVFMQQMQLWTGKQFANHQEATRYLILQMAGNTTAAQARKQQDKMGMLDSQGRVMSGKNAGQQVGQSTKDLWHTLGQNTATEKAYQDYVGQTGGVYSGAMAGLLTRMQKTGMEDHNVLIQTADGQRVMKISEAIEGGFSDQIASGRARMVGGKWAGKNLSDLGEGIDASARKGALRSTRKGSSAGQSLEDYLKENPEGLSGSRDKPNHVFFDLTDDAKKLLRPMGSLADAMGLPRFDTVTHARDFVAGSAGSAFSGIGNTAGAAIKAIF